MAETNGGSIVQIRNYHVVLVILSWLVLAGIAWGTLRTEQNEVERRIGELEKQHTLTYDQYKDGQAAIDQRLTRIENKLDAEQARRK